jgi:2'-5' RNA ligase
VKACPHNLALNEIRKILVGSRTPSRGGNLPRKSKPKLGLLALKNKRTQSIQALSGDQVRSFISIDLEDPQILSRVASILSSLQSVGGDLKPVERENIHLTLKFLGNVSTPRLGEVKVSLQQLDFPAFTAEIKGAGAFPNLNHMNVIWVGVNEGWSQVERIYEQVEKLLSGLGFRRENRPFSPHITIARVRSGKKRDEIANFLQHLSDESFGTITVDKVRLKQSILSSSGPKYSTLLEVSPRPQ